MLVAVFFMRLVALVVISGGVMDEVFPEMVGPGGVSFNVVVGVLSAMASLVTIFSAF